MEAHAAAHRNLGRQAQVVAGHGADHGVAPGQGVVGQEQHGLAVDGHLDGTGHRALAGQLARHAARQGLRPFQAHAHAVGLGGDAPGLLRQQCQRLGGKPVGARAQHHVQHHLVARTGPLRYGRSAPLRGLQGVGGHRSAHGQALARLQCIGANVGQGVGGAAAQHRRHLPAAAHCHVAAHAGMRCAQYQGVAIVQCHAGVAGHGPLAAVGRAQGQRHGCARHRQRGPAMAAQLQPAQQVLQHTLAHRVAHQAIGRTQGGHVQRPRGRNTQARHAVAAAVLHQGLQTSRYDFNSCWRLL